MSRAVNFLSEIISQFKANIPRVCVVWKSNKKANIGKYFILGIQGTIDIVTTWDMTNMTNTRVGGVCNNSVY